MDLAKNTDCTGLPEDSSQYSVSDIALGYKRTATTDDCPEQTEDHPMHLRLVEGGNEPDQSP